MASWDQADWAWCRKCACLFYGGNSVCAAVGNGVHDHSRSGTYTIPSRAGAPGYNGWRWCAKCQVLSYSGNKVGSCATPSSPNGKHLLSESGDYSLVDSGAGQKPWRWCNKCEGLAWGPGVCKTGGQHTFAGSMNYVLCLDGEPRQQANIGQDQWRHCRSCELLCYDGKTSCAAGGPHVSVGSSNYVITAPMNTPTPGAQTGWRWCNKCYGLAYSANPSDGTCPRGGTHAFGGSAIYNILANQATRPGYQDKWSWCKHCQQLWYSGNNAARCCFSPLGYHTAEGSMNYSLKMR